MSLSQIKSNPAINSFVTPGLTFIATALFVTFGLHARAHIGTLFLITLLWLFAFLPLVLSTHGDLIRMLQLLGQPRSFFQTYGSKFAQPTELQYATVTNFYSVILTTFIFSIYVPLDSETVLQDWPVAPVTGACLGLIIGVFNGVQATACQKP